MTCDPGKYSTGSLVFGQPRPNEIRVVRRRIYSKVLALCPSRIFVAAVFDVVDCEEEVVVMV